MSRESELKTSFCMCDAFLVPLGTPHEHRTLIKNIKIFDGEQEDLITGKNLVLKGNIIEGIVPDTDTEEGYEKVIDGKGGYLTPGLIDCHWHTMFGISASSVQSKPKTYITAIAIKEGERLLNRGVTAIRDAAGDVMGVKMAIDEGIIAGPRIYPSGAMITQYSGHGDFRNANFHLPKEWGGPISAMEQVGGMILANGVDQVLQATRNNLFLGATQIKLATSGGVCSFGDPLYVNEFLPEEISAACRAAEDFGTYVMVHCHNSSGAQRALKAGVKSFDHISMVDEETIKMLAEAGAWASVQVLVAYNIAHDYPKGDPRQVKAQLALDSTAQVLKWAKQHGLQLGWGTDILDSQELRNEQLRDLAMRTEFGFTSAELMIHATGNNGKILALCGKRNPYGQLGVIRPGAMADILIYEENPLEDIKVVENYDKTLKFVMKDGKEIKNKL